MGNQTNGIRFTRGPLGPAYFAEAFGHRYAVTNAAAGEPADVWLLGPVFPGAFFGEVDARGFLETLNEALANDPSEIVFHVNSPGGDVREGTTIANAIKGLAIPTRTIVEGWAASIASVIAIASDTVEMRADALMMIHNPRGIAFGEASDMRSMAEFLDKVRSAIAGNYLRQTRQTMSAILDAMDAETWYTADEAVAFGLVDGVAGGAALEGPDDGPAVEDFAAFAAAMGFRKVPAGALEKAAASDRGLAVGDETGTTTGIGSGYTPDLGAALNIGANPKEETAGMDIRNEGDLRAQYPELVAGVERAAASAAVRDAENAQASAVESERKRITQILNLAGSDLLDKAEELIAAGTDVGEAAVALNDARKAKAQGYVEKATQADAASGAGAAGASAVDPDTEAVETGGTAKGGGSPLDRWNRAVAAYRNAHPAASAAEAVRACRREHEDLHTAAFASGRPREGIAD